MVISRRYIYIYIYIERERERERAGGGEGGQDPQGKVTHSTRHCGMRQKHAIGVGIAAAAL